jgi:hypothetical protein
MNLRIKIILLCFLVVVACSKSEDSGKQAPLNPKGQDLSPPEPPKDQGKPLEPVKFSPEDQQKADNAPQGMVFIKGGCFRMGNNRAQAAQKVAEGE